MDGFLYAMRLILNHLGGYFSADSLSEEVKVSMLRSELG